MNTNARWKATGTISAAEFRTQIAPVVSFVEMTEEPVVIERHGKPVVVLLSVSEWQSLVKLRENLPPVILGVIQDGDGAAS